MDMFVFFQDNMAASKGYNSKKKSKRLHESRGGSTPSTPKSSSKSFSGQSITGNESDSDTAAGFDSSWKN